MTARPYAISLFACWLVIAHAGAAAASHYFDHQVRTRIQQQVGSDKPAAGFVCRGEPICGIELIPTIYSNRDYHPVWFDHNGLQSKARELAELIGSADRHGLRPSDYHAKTIRDLLVQLERQPFPPNADSAVAWADLDILLTDAYLMIGAHLSGGRINPETLHPDWIINERSLDMGTILEPVTSDDTLAKAIDRLQPGHQGYRGLLSALERLREVEGGGGWPVIEAKRTIRPSDANDQVIVLRQRLTISGDYAAASPPEDPAVNDPELVAAVKAFQRRHGLTPDGMVGPKTRNALNIGAKQRIRQIELNLERWRWLPADLGQRYIVVNTADFRLQIVENGQTVVDMPVVVGRPARKTPVFSATMSYMVLNPYWNVPYTIAVEDILPKLIQGADYLVEQGIKVFSGWNEDAEQIDPGLIDWTLYGPSNFPFRLRQDPGKKNALGQIKFMFPNKFAVYLHDTPQRTLFRRVQRDFSSGCIRVENAPLLASYLLTGDERWRPENLMAALATGERQVVRVPQPITVHLLYMTAWTDISGALQFRDDIYDRDAELDAALKKRNPYISSGLTGFAGEERKPKA